MFLEYPLLSLLTLKKLAKSKHALSAPSRVQFSFFSCQIILSLSKAIQTVLTFMITNKYH